MSEEKTFEEQIKAKSKKKKLIISLVSLFLGVAIATTVVVMSLVTVDLRPTQITTPSSFYFNNETYYKYDKTDDFYSEFLDQFENSFKISYLSGLFSSKLGGYEIVEEHISSLPNEVTQGNYVTFVYNDKITLQKSNGRVYYSKYNNNYSIDFYEVVFALSDENKVEDMAMYVKYDWTSSSNSTNPFYTKISLKGNTYPLNELYKGL